MLGSCVYIYDHPRSPICSVNTPLEVIMSNRNVLNQSKMITTASNNIILETLKKEVWKLTNTFILVIHTNSLRQNKFNCCYSSCFRVHSWECLQECKKPLNEDAFTKTPIYHFAFQNFRIFLWVTG